MQVCVATDHKTDIEPLNCRWLYKILNLFSIILSTELRLLVLVAGVTAGSVKPHTRPIQV